MNMNGSDAVLADISLDIAVVEALRRAIMAAGGSSEDVRAILDDPALALRIGSMIVRGAVHGGARWLEDREIPERFRPHGTAWRHAADVRGYAGHIALDIDAGMTLQAHRSDTHLCHPRVRCAAGLNFDDHPTRRCIVFCIPQPVPETFDCSVDGQLRHLEALHEQFHLPETHCASLGDAVILASIICAYTDLTGDFLGIDHRAIRTGTALRTGEMLRLVYDDEGHLYCGRWGLDILHGLHSSLFRLDTNEKPRPPPIACMMVGVEYL